MRKDPSKPCDEREARILTAIVDLNPPPEIIDRLWDLESILEDQPFFWGEDDGDKYFEWGADSFTVRLTF